jgi:acetolactate synthase I/III small subunit
MEPLPTFTFSILVENRFGVLFNITGLFSSRGYNIERLMVVPDNKEPGLSRITMVAHCSPALAEQIVKQLHKQIDVISVEVTDKETSWPTSITKSTATPA